MLTIPTVRVGFCSLICFALSSSCWMPELWCANFIIEEASPFQFLSVNLIWIGHTQWNGRKRNLLNYNSNQFNVGNAVWEMKIISPCTKMNLLHMKDDNKCHPSFSLSFFLSVRSIWEFNWNLKSTFSSIWHFSSLNIL